VSNSSGSNDVVGTSIGNLLADCGDQELQGSDSGLGNENAPQRQGILARHQHPDSRSHADLSGVISHMPVFWPTSWCQATNPESEMVGFRWILFRTTNS
jgi:hypothetical protein